MECGRKAKLGGKRRGTGLKPLTDFRLKAGLRREVSPRQTSPSEYRLQPEACEGLQARVVGISKVLAAPHTPVGTEPDPPALSQPAVIWDGGTTSVSSAWVQHAPRVLHARRVRL